MITARDSRYLSKAEELSKQSDHYKFRIGCVIAKGRKQLVSGCNSLTKTHPLQHHYASLVGRPDAIYLHAEMAAIVEARSKCIDLRGASVYVFRRGLSGKIAIARPCKSCMMALTEAGVCTIIYTTDIGVAREYIGG